MQSTELAKPINLSWTAGTKFQELNLRHKSDVHYQSDASRRKKRKSSAFVWSCTSNTKTGYRSVTLEGKQVSNGVCWWPTEVTWGVNWDRWSHWWKVPRSRISKMESEATPGGKFITAIFTGRMPGFCLTGLDSSWKPLCCFPLFPDLDLWNWIIFQFWWIGAFSYWCLHFIWNPVVSNRDWASNLCIL